MSARTGQGAGSSAGSPRRSAGLLVHRDGPTGVELLLAHMGGPLWARKDERAWTIPKGEFVDPEEPLAAARREFAEELGMPAPDGPVCELGDVRQAGGKVVTVFAIGGQPDLGAFAPGTFTMSWPPRSGVLQEFPEVDRIAWVGPDDARRLLVTAQAVFVDRLLAVVAAGGDGRPAGGSGGSDHSC
jgi:predicted NUDIX family NTP pyrophosphohydrolase